MVKLICREGREQGEDEVPTRRIHGRGSCVALSQKESSFLGRCRFGRTHV